MYTLHIANKNYSSWSLRPWVLLTEADIAFEEVVHPFGDQADWDNYRKINGAGLVPSLIDNDTVVWDSLAIVEFLAEKHPGIWPADEAARIWARCAAAEMHSGLFELRGNCPMNCGLRVELNELSPGLLKDIARVEELWQQGITKFGGPFLAGSSFSAVDAFFVPVVFRFQTYGIELNSTSSAYVNHILNLDSVKDWYDKALNEPYRDKPHDLAIEEIGRIIEDQRKPVE